MNYKRLNEKMGDFFENVTGEELVVQLEELGYVLTENEELAKKDLIAIVGETCCDNPEQDFDLPCDEKGWCKNCKRKM